MLEHDSIVLQLPIYIWPRGGLEICSYYFNVLNGSRLACQYQAGLWFIMIGNGREIGGVCVFRGIDNNVFCLYLFLYF